MLSGFPGVVDQEKSVITRICLLDVRAGERIKELGAELYT